jgi:hypothetical protein
VKAPAEASGVINVNGQNIGEWEATHKTAIKTQTGEVQFIRYTCEVWLYRVGVADEEKLSYKGKATVETMGRYGFTFTPARDGSRNVIRINGFTVMHRPSDGALTLAAKVLAMAAIQPEFDQYAQDVVNGHMAESE